MDKKLVAAIQGLGLGIVPQIMENQMDKNMEYEMETGFSFV